jgi:predicted nucleic acid-binding protein
LQAHSALSSAQAKSANSKGKQAALLALDVKSGLRAGDALHLAVALGAKVHSMATLDDVLARNAALMKLPLATI